MNSHESPEKYSGEGRRKLLALEKQAIFVFHGSPVLNSELTPRQAYNSNLETGNEEEDGNPAVFASPFADVAIFRALINAQNTSEDSNSMFGMDDDGLHFSCTQNLLTAAKGKTAFVYVFDKSKFIKFQGSECRCEEPLLPIQTIEVNVDDLPQNFKIINESRIS